MPHEIRRQDSLERVPQGEACLPDETEVFIVGSEGCLYCKQCESFITDVMDMAVGIGYNVVGASANPSGTIAIGSGYQSVSPSIQIGSGHIGQYTGQSVLPTVKPGGLPYKAARCARENDINNNTIGTYSACYFGKDDIYHGPLHDLIHGR